MSTLGFENIFKKYNISCEAPKKIKRPKLQKQKYVPHKNHSCIHLGRSDESKAGNEALKLTNISLPSYHNVSKSAKELKTKKMWESIRSKRRYKPLDLIVTKRINMDGTNTTQSQNSSSLITGAGGSYDVSLKNSSTDVINMNLTKHEGEKKLLDETNENISQITQSPMLSFNSSYLEKTKSYLEPSNSLDLKKKNRNSTPKYLYRHRPLPLLNTSAINQTSKELSTIQRPCSNGNNNLVLTNSSTSFLENSHKSYHSIKRNSPKPLQIFDSSTTSSQQPSDQPTELDLLSELIENDNTNITERTKSNTQEIFNSSVTSSSSFKYSLEASQIIETPTTSSQQSIDQPTELDLLLELIENDNKKIAERAKSNAHEISYPKRPCQKGGIEEHFLRVLNQNKIGGKYLKHDKKYGLKQGIPLRITNLETAYGVSIATVQCLDTSKEFCTVITPEMVAQVKIGSLIESYLDDICDPYSWQFNGKHLDLFLQPFKLLVL